MKGNITKMSFRELLALKDCLDMLNGKYVNEMRAFPTCYDKVTLEESMRFLNYKKTKISNALTEVINEIEKRILE